MKTNSISLILPAVILLILGCPAVDCEDAADSSSSDSGTEESGSTGEDCQSHGAPCHPTANPNATLFCCSTVCSVDGVCQ